MSKILKIFLLLFLIGFAGNSEAWICKWVDENGVTHYGESCPDEADGEKIQTDEGPTQEEIDATKNRSESLQATRLARREQEQLDQQINEEELLARQESSNAAIEQCAQARVSLGVLRKPLPVYYDQSHQLHFNRSAHDLWYQGTRTYLDDAQRQAEIEQYVTIEAETCTDSEADIRERIRIYMQMSHEDSCQMLRQRLQSLQTSNTGIPSDEMRDLQQRIQTYCN